LKPLTKYYFRAFATNSAGSGYGNEISFSTSALVVGAKVLDGLAFDIDTSALLGLACAPMDEGTLSGSNGSYVNTSATALGNGYDNTNLIYTAQGGNAATYAAIACTYHIGEIYSNSYSVIWYLPSKNELSKLFADKDAIGNLSDGAYWSSTEFVLRMPGLKILLQVKKLLRIKQPHIMFVQLELFNSPLITLHKAIFLFPDNFQSL
jgi:hypothetical protein